MKSLKTNAYKSLLWTFIDTVFVKLIPFVTTIYIARLILPYDFGLIASVSLLYQISILFIDSGMSSSLIRTNNPSEEDISTLFYFNVFIGVLLFLLCVAIAPLIGFYYNEPKLNQIVIAYGLIIIIVSFSSIQNALFCKELKFKELTKINFISTIISSILGILFTHLGYEYWSLILMQMTYQFFFTSLIWVKSEWKPKLLFSYTKLKYHFDFGYKLMLSGFLNVFHKEIYKVIIAKNYSIATVGEYDRAKTLNDYPNSIFSSILTKVSYPLFVKYLQENDSTEKASKMFKKIIKVNFLVFIPFSFFLASISEIVIEFLLGKRWTSTLFIFKTLCFASAFFSAHTLSVNILKSFGRSDLFLQSEIVKKIFFGAIIITSFYFGFKGLLLGIVMSSIVELFINSYYINKLINYKWEELIIDVLPITCFSFMVYILTDYFINTLATNNLIKFVLIVSLTSGSYLVYNIITKSAVYEGIKQIIDKKNQN